jgi:Tfp pilus assembly protein PilO
MFGIPLPTDIEAFFAKWGVIILVALAVAGGAYWYFNWSQNKIEALSGQVDTLQQANKVDDATINTLKSNELKQAQIQQQANTQLQQVQNHAHQLEQLLSKIDIAALASQNSAKVQAEVNQTTSDFIKQLSASTDPSVLSQPLTPTAPAKKDSWLNQLPLVGGSSK